MSELIGAGDDAVLHAGGEKARKRTCNLHYDCDAADQAATAKNRYADHCHDDCCEDCFGQ